MEKVLVVVDMQHDFIDGALGTAEARAILPAVKQKIEQFDGLVVYTRDSHGLNYSQTQEGRLLPVPHCIAGTEGWQIHPELPVNDSRIFDKPSFGSKELAEFLADLNISRGISEICLIGLCTDICVISNALLLKAFMPEVLISVDAACCAGVTVQSHLNALEAMKMCQINIINQ